MECGGNKETSQRKANTIRMDKKIVGEVGSANGMGGMIVDDVYEESNSSKTLLKFMNSFMFSIHLHRPKVLKRRRVLISRTSTSKESTVIAI